MTNATDALRALTPNQRRYLSRRACAWCGMPLNRPGCGAIGQQCSEDNRIARMERCLSEYKPRPALHQRKENGHAG